MVRCGPPSSAEAAQRARDAGFAEGFEAGRAAALGEAQGWDSATDCIDCVAGTYVHVAGSDQASDCIGCLAGK